MAVGRLQDCQNNLNRCSAPSGVMDAAPAFADGLPERIKGVPLSRPASTAGHGNLARAVSAVDQNAVRRQPHIATFAGCNNHSEVRQIRLLHGEHPATEAESLVRFKITRSRHKRLACPALAM